MSHGPSARTGSFVKTTWLQNLAMHYGKIPWWQVTVPTTQHCFKKALLYHAHTLQLLFFLSYLKKPHFQMKELINSKSTPKVLKTRNHGTAAFFSWGLQKSMKLSQITWIPTRHPSTNWSIEQFNYCFPFQNNFQSLCCGTRSLSQTGKGLVLLQEQCWSSPLHNPRVFAP